MKKLLLPLLTCLLWTSLALAQGLNPTAIVEETRAMSKGSFNALVLQLPNTTKKEVLKEWQKFVRDYKGKTKYDKRTDECFTDNAIVKEMSENTVDIFVKVVEDGAGGTTMAAWFGLGVTYLSSKDYPERYPVGEAMMKFFAGTISQAMIEEDLKAQQKVLEELNENLVALGKAQQDYKNNIEKQKEIIRKAEESIAVSEKNIEKNKEAQSSKQEEIKDQETVVTDIEKLLEEIKRKNNRK